MRSASDVLSRLQWDCTLINTFPSYSVIIIGYLDRFEGNKEMPFCKWLSTRGDVTHEELIPQHRIQYFKVSTTGDVLWDKVQRIDRIFDSTAEKSAKPAKPPAGELRARKHTLRQLPFLGAV